MARTKVSAPAPFSEAAYRKAKAKFDADLLEAGRKRRARGKIERDYSPDMKKMLRVVRDLVTRLRTVESMCQAMVNAYPADTFAGRMWRKELAETRALLVGPEAALAELEKPDLTVVTP